MSCCLKRGLTGSSATLSVRISGADGLSRPVRRFCSRARTRTAMCIRPAGVRAGPRCTISRIFLGCYPTILKSNRRTAKGSIGRSTTPISRHIGTRSPTMSASPAMPRLRKLGDPPVNLIRCRPCGLFRAATSGKRASRRTACGLRRPPSASIRRHSKADRPASTTAGAMSAVRSERCLIRSSPISAKHGRRAPRCGRMLSSRAF